MTSAKELEIEQFGAHDLRRTLPSRSAVVLLIIWHTFSNYLALIVEDLSAIPQASREIAPALTIPGRGVRPAGWLLKDQFPIEPRYRNERICNRKAE
jgi:hypothetical protein